MKKSILSLILIIALLLMNVSFQILNNVENFNSSEVLSKIEYISSNQFKGRLAGTLENRMVGEFIKSQFQKNGLKPYNGSYSDSFVTKYPKKDNTPPFLRIVDKTGKLITEYQYGKDYKEDMLNFKKNSFIFNSKNSLYFSEDSLQVMVGSDPFIFYVPENNKLDFRSSFISDSKFSMYIMLTKSTLTDIQEHIKKGNQVECFIPYSVSETPLDNIVGVIKGRNSEKPPVILSAHFDHIGTDLANNVYTGALDNASGVAFILEISKFLKSLGIPERDIIFAAFNAEEFGCLGSRAFAEKYKSKLNGGKVFNFDMIGSNNDVPLSIMGGRGDTEQSSLIRSVSSTCNNTKTSFKYIFEDASDHEYFRKIGIDAITFCDNDLTRIHTPSDKSTSISTASISRCFKVASREVLKYGYNNNLLFIYYNEVLLGSIFCIIIILSTHLFTSKEQE
jgi:hypothetical protein